MTQEQKKTLFIKQVNTMKTLKEHGAITEEQYNFSFNGLVKKMGVTEKELSEWLK